MAESMCRALRDGSLEGELAPALTIRDSVHSPFGLDVFNHVLIQHSSNILAGKSQSRGLVLVAFSRSPSFYVNLLESRGVNLESPRKWFQILDCYTDPLGWKDQLMRCGKISNISQEASTSTVSLCKDVRDVDKLFSSIIELGKGLIGEGKGRFSVAMDLYFFGRSLVFFFGCCMEASCQVTIVDQKVARDIVLTEETKNKNIMETAAFEYMSSMVATLEPMSNSTNGPRVDSENLPLLEQSYRKGKLSVRFKRRNGRVRLMSEFFHVEQSGINFTSVSSEDIIINQGLSPKVQFNLQLSEKEQIDRANVILPFEHQGNGKPIQIYDGRRSLADVKDDTAPASTLKSQMAGDSGKGEIIYFRDSDDEMPDSDEDPDDDLDI
ncbi:elongator complex protein 5 isoform X1 [Malania oleifera]|uniref:elongator complex protein 5 isoform X1 n=1 Tax=Malania oleifera TaxID=397392 RepID=UPI0025ADA145|nr:elongator complex protein 5 isoform X1 [Malania oleifera]